MRALIVDDDVDRATLVAARDLAADGWLVGTASRTPSLASRSRTVKRWDQLPSLEDGEDPFVAELARVLRDQRYDVVLTTWDPAVELVSRRRRELSAVVPYGDHDGVATALDKRALAVVAQSVGVETPRTVDDAAQALNSFRGRVVVKPDEHGWKRIRARICEGSEDVLEAARAISSAGGKPLFQEEVRGELMSLALVLGRDSEPLSISFQSTDAVWPTPVGVTVRAHTLPLDRSLLQQSSALLQQLEWFGLAQLQFLRTEDGRDVLIDLNPRAYGSLALALRAGAKHTSQWARAALGLPTERQEARPGIYYQWFTRDLRAQARRHGLGGVRSAAMLAPTAAHSIWSRDEPSFAIRYFAGRVISHLRPGRR